MLCHVASIVVSEQTSLIIHAGLQVSRHYEHSRGRNNGGPMLKNQKLLYNYKSHRESKALLQQKSLTTFMTR